MRAFLKQVLWNSQERRPRALWRLLGQFVLFFVGTLLFAILFGLVVVLATRQLDPSAPAFMLAGIAATLLAAILSMWVAARVLDRRPFADFGLHLSRDWWLDLGFGLLLGALLMTGIFLVEWTAGWLTIAGTFRTAGATQPFALAILGPLALFLCVGIYEELLTRGYLLRNLAEALNYPAVGPRGAITLAWALSSVLFGLLHAGNPNASLGSTINLVLAGVFLGLGYVLTGQLAIPIGLHIAWNFFQGNVFGFPVSGSTVFQATFIAIEQRGPDLWTGGAFGPEAGLIGILASLVGGLLILLWVRLRYGRVGLYTALAEPPVRQAPFAEPAVTTERAEIVGGD